MQTNNIKIDPSWRPYLINEFEKPYMKALRAFLQNEISQKKIIYPKADRWFEAFAQTPFDKVKVVILGQDPYHGPGQAHGLCFSVQEGVDLPPSLRNIYQELSSDVGVKMTRCGLLTPWAKQGVFLLNAILTVENGRPASHHKQGWEEFTDKVIEVLNQEKSNLVFILWGSYAQKKGFKIDRQKHLVLEAPHPSPLSSHRGFFGSKPFSKTNKYLQTHGIETIDWSLDLRFGIGPEARTVVNSGLSL